jgi:phosphonate transport system substrate-binding protein
VISRRTAALGALALAPAALAACGPTPGGGHTTARPTTIAFSILSAEDAATAGQQWQPLLAEMSRTVGAEIRPFFASNYTALIEAMRSGQTQAGWFSALPALQAVNRANAMVIGRFPDAESPEGYRSVLIVRSGSPITIDQVTACGRRHSFGIGDAQSTSGTLAPMTFLFAPRGIAPADCFAAVRSASQQANLFAVANGVVDIATSNTIEISRARRENAAIGNRVQVIWQSPPLPSSSIVVRRDLDPALREGVRRFLLAYGAGPGPDAQRQRQILRNLSFGQFQLADESYLDPVRLMQAVQALEEARHAGDPAAVTRAQARVGEVRRSIASRGGRP